MTVDYTYCMFQTQQLQLQAYQTKHWLQSANYRPITSSCGLMVMCVSQY